MTEGKPQLSARRYSWIGKAKDREGQGNANVSFQDNPSQGIAASTYSPSGAPGLFSRAPPSSSSISTITTTDTAERPPMITHRSSSSSLTRQQLDQQTSQIIQNALERTNSQTPSANVEQYPSRPTGSFSKLSFSTMMGGLSTLSLSRSNNEERGRSNNKHRSSSVVGRNNNNTDDANNTDTSYRTRSMSPFRRRRSHTRDASPTYEALKLPQSDGESDSEAFTSKKSIRPRNAFSQSVVSDDESVDDMDSDADSEESWSDNDTKFDPITTQNTEQNSLIPSADFMEQHDSVEAPDPLGEGVNIIVPPEPYFPSTLNNTGKRNARRRKSSKYDALPITTSRPIFQRDRCTITISQGDPIAALEQNQRKRRKYVVASDLSEESRYAVEWGVGTVIRDGDELFIVSVREDENKIDPANPQMNNQTQKIKSQQERQTLAYILVRQVTSLLQRTKLNVTVSCQAWHAKNARRMLLDIIDYLDPTMVIVGSRGLGKIKGILLGSTSHYLVQKCSVPVMVARRRLKRPAKKSAHLATHRARKTLAEAAGVERVTPKVDKDVEHMRDELEREEDRREDVNYDDIDTELENDSPLGRKAAGD